MLNFTISGKEYDGQYNGRFLFYAPHSNSNISQETLININQGNDHYSDDFKIALIHEALHWRIFQNSRTGIEIIGRRFRARNAILNENINEVVNYYKQRTAYFIASYDLHEHLVKLCENNNAKSSIKDILSLDLSEYKSIVEVADKISDSYSQYLGVMQPKYKRYYDYLNGLRVTRELGIQARILDQDGKIKLYETTFLANGIFNAAFSDKRINDDGFVISKLKWIRRCLNREGRRSLTSEKWLNLMATWAAIKFITEWQTLVELEGFGQFTSERYGSGISNFSNFIYRHILINNSDAECYLPYLIEECKEVKINTNKFIEIVNEFSHLDKSDNGLLYYFYIHGN